MGNTSETAKAMWRRPEYRRNMAIARKGMGIGEKNSMWGKKHSEETREKMSIAGRGRKKSEEHKRKISKAQKGRHHTPANDFKMGNTINIGRTHSEEIRKKMSEARIGRIVSEETRRKISESNKGKPLSDKHKKKLSIASKGKKHSKQWRMRLSETKKKQWQNPEFCRMMGRAWDVKPNKPEIVLLKLLNSLYPDEWKYAGDFSFTINGKCPDFVNCNGQKKVIEFNGTYWHRNDISGEREKMFAEFGYKTLIIWDTEFKDMNALIQRIESFCEVK